MRSCEDERLCQEAQVHYYDLLCQEEAAVPALVRRHVATCPVCKEKMRRLRESLFEAQRPASQAGDWQDETVEALAQQFQLLDERVTCSQVKPLLPELMLESPQIRIPTPVTVHVDHCPQCAEDLAAIRELHLSADQLKRLGRLLNAGRGAHRCRVEGVPSAKRGLEARAPAVPGSGSFEAAEITCHEIAVADLFDCIVPSDSEPSGGRTTRERQKAIARHVQGCPVCLARARTLQRTIGEIAARADSEVVTVYHADNDAKEAESEYPYPVSVQVLRSDSTAAGDARGIRAALATGLRKLERSAKPLAALVLIGVALTMLLRTTTPTALGTNAGDVDKILAKMENVHIVKSDWQAGVIQESWIRRSKILVSMTKEDCILDDLTDGRRRILNLQTGVHTSERLSRDGRDRVRQFTAGRLSSMVTEVAPDTKLRAAGEFDNGAGQTFDVYELPLSSQTGDSLRRTRYEVYIDRATGLPRGLMSYRSAPGAKPGVPTTIIIFEYPTDQEMDEILGTLFPAE